MKKGLTRRMLAFLLTLAMVLSLLPMAVFADSRTNPGLYAEPDAEHPFTDVPEGKYYYDAVYWAYNHDPRITAGSSGTTFSPNDPCTREQVVTFLWRANGEPEPTATESSFTDVPEGKYYTKAVLWAVEKEITAGATSTTFNPKGACTREQVVTFLWRAMGKPTPATTENPFTDVPEGKYYYEAVLWAYENGITSGATSTTFNPKGACTRAQIVTFLFRTFSLAEDLSGKTIILHTNDTHGALLGFAQVAQLRKDFEAQGATVILVDAGDYSQGTPYVSVGKGEAAITVMNAAGYHLATLGNHEFDFGYAQLMENLSKAEFKPIVADVLLKQTGKSILDGHTILDMNGVKIGFFGMETPETFTKVNPSLIQELTFPQGEELYACAQAEVDALKAEGAALVIGLVHLGVDNESEPNRSIDLYNHVTGIDFLIDGHSHTVMTAGPNGEPIQSTGTKASDTALMNVGMIQIDNATGKIEKNKLIPLGDNAPVDPEVAAVAQAIMDEIDAQYGAKFAESRVELNGDKIPGNRNMETNLGDLITDSMLWSVQKNGSLEVPDENVIAITNGGGIRAWIHRGDVTMNDIHSVLPFGNTIAVVYVTGAELLEALEASTYCTPGTIGGFPQVAGFKYTINTAKAFDQGDQYPDSTYYAPASIRRVTINEINGQAFDPAATYAVVTNNFCAGGGDTYYRFKDASAQFDTSIPLDEALIEYITDKLGAVIDEPYAEPQGRITVIPAPSVNGTFPSSSNDDIAKYGNIYTDINGADLFAAGFTWGDVVTVKFLEQTIEMPIVPTFSYVDQGTPGVFVNKDSETGEPTGRVFMAINMGNFAEFYGLATKTTNPDKSYYWTPMEGVEFPVPVTITVADQGGYATEMEIRDINRTNNRDDYPGLTDEEFANFRRITTTGMGDHLYRGSSPINPEIGRNTYADAAIENAGVTVIMNLANSQAEAEAYEGFADTYYSGQNVIYLNLGVDFAAEDFQAGLANGLRHFAQNEGVYYVHCTEGKDRAGFVSALLECLMGATYDEVVADYLKTYTNYYTVVDGVQQPLSRETLDAIASSNIIKTLKTAFEVEDLTVADLAAEAEEYIKAIGLTDDEIAALKTNLAGDTQHRLQLVEDAGDMLKYGHLVIDVSTEDLLKEFAYGDIVTVTVEGYGAIDAPICSNYDDVDTGAALIRAKSGKDTVNLAINYGQIGVQLGIIEKAPEGSSTTYQVKEGVTFPIYVTIEMKEAGGYADELAVRAMNRDDDHANRATAYPGLTDAEYANFRVVGTTGMGENTLYRSSSPINPEIGRNAEADAAAQAAGIKTFMNMADSQAEAEAYAGYAETYYASQNKIFLGMPVAFTTDEFKAGLAEGYRFIASNDGPYLIHCTEGKDRTGLGVAVLESLMGATLEEVQADYLQTYINYYNVVDGVQQALTDEQKEAVKHIITNNLGIVFDADLTTADLADEAEDYLTEIGMTDDEIAALKTNLAGETPQPTAPYEVAESVEAGDQIIMVYTVGDKYYAMSSDVSENGVMTPVEVTVTDGVLTAADSSTVFTLAAGSAEGSYQIKTAEGKALNYSGSGTGIYLQDAGSDWTLTPGAGTSRIKAANSTNRYLYVQSYQNALRIKCYTEGNMTASGYYSTATIYKVVTNG